MNFYAEIASIDELVAIISSTYISINIVVLDLLKMNKDASDLEAVNPRSNNFEISLEYQALGACFNP